MPTIPPPFVLAPADVPWGRSVDKRLADLERSMERAQTQQDAANKSQEAALAGMERTILSMGQTMASSSTQSPISATASAFTTVASTSITSPRGRSRAVISLSGSIALLDMVTPGTAAAPQARFLIAGVPRPLGGTVGIPAAKDSGASRTNNIISLADAIELYVSEGTIVTADLQVAVYHSTAFASASPSNYATVAMQATFLS